MRMLRVMTKLGVFEGYDGGEGGEGERGTRRAGQRLRSEGLHSGWVALGKRLSLSGLHTDVCYMSLMPGSASWGVRMERRLWVRGLLQTWMKSALGTWELSVIFVILVIAGHAERFDRYYWLSVPRWFSFRKEGWRPRVSTGTRKFLQLGW